MEKLLISGGNKLYGQTFIDSSKNAILPILAGSIMSEGKVVLNNITYYEDVKNMLAILKHLGVYVKEYENSVILDASSIKTFNIPLELASKLRASIFFLGPLLSKMKKARVAYPGGCSIGARPIDIHISGLQRLGAKVLDRHGILYVDGENLKQGNYFMPFPSVGATENYIMASMFLKGTSYLYGAAKEPEIVDLCNFLNGMGAKIKGAGSDIISITGVKKLGDVTYSPMPDRIVAGTYLLAPLICGGEVELTNCRPKHIKSLLDIVPKSACKIAVSDDKIKIRSGTRMSGLGKIETMPYPFFPTDLSQPLSALASVAKGNTIIVENLFENRFNHVPELVKMGAKITVKDRAILIEGQKELFGANVDALDLRGGAALVLAGLCANGYTSISNVNIIDRGYYKIEQKLSMLGAKIERIT